MIETFKSTAIDLLCSTRRPRATVSPAVCHIPRLTDHTEPLDWNLTSNSPRSIWPKCSNFSYHNEPFGVYKCLEHHEQKCLSEEIRHPEVRGLIAETFVRLYNNVLFYSMACDFRERQIIFALRFSQEHGRIRHRDHICLWRRRRCTSMQLNADRRVLSLCCWWLKICRSSSSDDVLV